MAWASLSDMCLIEKITALSDPESISDLWLSPGQKVAVEGARPRTLSQTEITPEEYTYLRNLCRLPADACDLNTTAVIGPNRFRINFYRASGRDRAALRLLKETVPTPEALRVPKQIVEICMRATNGIVLFAGATGSGKSTSLASILQHWAQQNSGHVVTLEAPIEYLLVGTDPLQFSQREVGLDVPSFQIGLKSALRQFPKIIMVQEIIDPESALAAIDAAQTGHLVFSTLHTGRVKQTIQSLLKLLPEARLSHATHTFAHVFKAIVCQRLVRVPVVGSKAGEMTRFAIHEVATWTQTMANFIVKNQMDHLDGEIITGRSVGHQTFELSIDKAIAEGLMQPSAKKAVMESL